MMDSESPSTPPEDENPQITTAADSSAQADNPTSNQIDRDFLKEKPPPPPETEDDDDESIDESRDTTSRTSTRLVKFQLFETKTVISKLCLC